MNTHSRANRQPPPRPSRTASGSTAATSTTPAKSTAKPKDSDEDGPTASPDLGNAAPDRKLTKAEKQAARVKRAEERAAKEKAKFEAMQSGAQIPTAALGTAVIDINRVGVVARNICKAINAIEIEDFGLAPEEKGITLAAMRKSADKQIALWHDRVKQRKGGDAKETERLKPLGITKRSDGTYKVVSKGKE